MQQQVRGLLPQWQLHCMVCSGVLWLVAICAMLWRLVDVARLVEMQQQVRVL
jgi:hypothetical protein